MALSAFTLFWNFHHHPSPEFFTFLNWNSVPIKYQLPNSLLHFLLPPHHLAPGISVQSLSRVWLFAIPWTTACQAFLPVTNSWSLLKHISIESVMPSNHLILCRPLLLLPSIFPSIYSCTFWLWIWLFWVPGINVCGFPGGSAVKNLHEMQETQVRSLGWEGPLEKELVAHSSILAWEIPWTEEPGGLQSTGSQRFGQDLATKQQQSVCVK